MPYGPNQAPAVSRALRAAGLGVVPDRIHAGLHVSKSRPGTAVIVAQHDLTGQRDRAIANAITVLEEAGYSIRRSTADDAEHIIYATKEN